jgi:hypothetical protein
MGFGIGFLSWPSIPSIRLNAYLDGNCCNQGILTTLRYLFAPYWGSHWSAIIGNERSRGFAAQRKGRVWALRRSVGEFRDRFDQKFLSA